MGGMGYWYYTDTQNTIAVLTANNAKLEWQLQEIETSKKSNGRKLATSYARA